MMRRKISLKLSVRASIWLIGPLPILSLGNARPKRMYFVVFYGSTADFAWVGETTIIPYHGVEAFTTYAQEAVDKVWCSSVISK